MPELSQSKIASIVVHSDPVFRIRLQKWCINTALECYEASACHAQCDAAPGVSKEDPRSTQPG